MANPTTFTLPTRTFTNAKGEVVAADSPDAVTLLGAEGAVIGMAQAVKLGLVDKPNADKGADNPAKIKARKGASNKADL